MKITTEQKLVCERYGIEPYGFDEEQKVGIAENTKTPLLPINGLRHKPEGDTSGWYIWSGEELSQDPGFFVPLHGKHIPDWNTRIMKFLGLPPGSRFLVGKDSEDVWFDETLLNE